MEEFKVNIRFEENTNLGMQLKINRIKRGYTIKELSEKSGVSASTIAFAEVGRTNDMRLDSIIQLAETLNVSLEELIVERKIVVVWLTII